MKSDQEIQQDVMDELRWQPQLAAANIGVAVKNGIVTLSGMVDSYTQKLAAENAVRRVFGVKAIAEDMQIGVSPYYKKTDAEIAESVVSALKWHASVPDEKIKAKVEDGIVTLEGTVEWDFQRMAARNTVSGLLGVRSVINLMKLAPKLSAGDINKKISAALHRSATVDSQKVKVEVSGSKIILRGMVRSHAEKEDAESAAWCAPGVSTVESYLVVEPQMELAF